MAISVPSFFVWKGVRRLAVEILVIIRKERSKHAIP